MLQNFKLEVTQNGYLKTEERMSIDRYFFLIFTLPFYNICIEYIIFIYCKYIDSGVFINRMTGFYLYVSNTTFKEDGQLCYHDRSSELKMLSEDQHINCSVQGRYVIYFNERNPNATDYRHYSKFAFNELCEVEVYGKSRKLIKKS